MKIWKKYLFAKLAKTFFFFLASLFGIYVIIDLSAHGVRFFAKTDFPDVLLYYFYTFSSQLELFLTLAFLLASMRVLFDIVEAKEIIALLMAGLSKKKLLAPFFIFASFLTLACYINNQWFSPEAQDNTYAFKTTYKNKLQKKEKNHVYSLLLDDGSELVYQSFDKEKKELFDVFWIRCPTDIWHMKYLQIDPVEGTFVNHLTRNQNQQFEKSESFLIRPFPDLPWDDALIVHRFVPFENRPLTTLFSQAMADPAEKTSVFSHLYYKLLTPFIPFLILFAIAPISIQFSRTQPLFLIASAAIFGLIAVKVILDGMLILGENQVLPAFLALFSPIALILALALPPFVRMR